MTNLVLYFLLLAGCGNAVSSTKRATRAPGEDTTFFISSFSPAAGTVSSSPTTITVTFNEIPNRDLLAVQTHYSLDCGPETVHAASVDAESGYSSVVVTFDALAASSGTVCVFTVASNLQNESGSRLGGTRTANYTIQ